MAGAEIITRRRKWTGEEKAALLAEVEAERGRVAMVARRHGLPESPLYNWRSVAKVAMPTHGSDPIELRPIGVIGWRNAVPPALRAAPESGSPGVGDWEERASKIEIALPNGARVKVKASVSKRALSRVLRAVKGTM